MCLVLGGNLCSNALKPSSGAAEVVAHAIDYANAQNMSINSFCPFVTIFIETNPEFKEVALKVDRAHP